MLNVINATENRKYKKEFTSFLRKVDESKEVFAKVLELKAKNNTKYIKLNDTDEMIDKVDDFLESLSSGKVEQVKGVKFYNITFSVELLNIEFHNCEFICCSFHCQKSKLVFFKCSFKQLPNYNGDYRRNYNVFDIEDESIVRFLQSKIASILVRIDYSVLYFNKSDIVRLKTSESKRAKLFFYNTNITYSRIIDIDILVFALFDTKFNDTVFCPTGFRVNEDSKDDLSLTYLVQVFSLLAEDYLSKNNRYYYHIYYLLGKLVCDSKEYKGVGLSNSNLFERMCSYFIMPTHILKLMIFWIISFAIIYLFIGLRLSGSEDVLFSIATLRLVDVDIIHIKNFAVNLNQSLYFSCITFTTVGYGDVVIRSNWEILPMIEMLIGITFMGIFTGSIFKRYV